MNKTVMNNVDNQQSLVDESFCIRDLWGAIRAYFLSKPEEWQLGMSSAVFPLTTSSYYGFYNRSSNDVKSIVLWDEFKSETDKLTAQRILSYQSILKNISDIEKRSPFDIEKEILCYLHNPVYSEALSDIFLKSLINTKNKELTELHEKYI